jgi:glycine/D-amino acid oxidase-like deaminating enzyme
VIAPLAFADLKLEPYWWEAAPLAADGGERPPSTADVAVVGAGYTGLAAALRLARGGRSVVVLEAAAPGEGASTRNGGITSGNIKIPFSTLIDTYGLDLAVALYAEGKRARQALQELIDGERIACDYQACGRFTGANTPAHYGELAREADLLRKHVGIEAEMVTRAEQTRELGTDHYFGGEVRPDVGALHPALFHKGLLERAKAAGAVVVGRARVRAVVPVGRGFEVATAKGSVIVRDALIATNGYTGPATPWFHRRVIPIRSQIIATEPLRPDVMKRLMPKGRVLGDTGRLYNYYRPSPDGRRILFGGRAGADKVDPRLSGAHLYRNLVAVFPELAGVGITHSWSGYVAYTFDLLPHVGRHDGVHYALGYCGSGVVWAPWLGDKAALRILGRAGEAESTLDHFPIQAVPIYHGRPWFLPAVMAWYGFRDRLDQAKARKARAAQA